MAVSVEREYTSKTLCPRQRWESGSSCTARRPQSAFPVIGSSGTLRRKRTFAGVWLEEDDWLDAADPFAVPIRAARFAALIQTWGVPPTLTVTPVVSVSRSGG